jgi:hypothetical protein
MVKIVLRFRPDLAELIEPNRRRSRTTLRIWRLKFGKKCPEDEMQNHHIIYLQLLSDEMTLPTCKTILIIEKYEPR